MDQKVIDTVVTQLKTEFPDTSEEEIRLKVSGLIKIADEVTLGNRAKELLGAAL